jgi:hypothetical protein
LIGKDVNNIYWMYLNWVKMFPRDNFIGYCSGVDNFTQIQKELYNNGYLEVVKIGEKKHTENIDYDSVGLARGGVTHKLFISDEGVEHLKAMSYLHIL